MKKMSTVLVVLLLIVSFIFASSVTVAGNGIQQITAYINQGILMTWDGQSFEPKEEDGSRLYPIIYEGRTYLPAKFVADKAGVYVRWDEDTKTVIFQSQENDLIHAEPYKDAEPLPERESESNLSSLSFVKFDLEIEGDDEDNELEVDFITLGYGWYEAEVEIENGKEIELKGQAALDYLLPIFNQLDIKSSMAKQEIVEAVIEAFDWEYDYDEFEIEVLFKDGSKIDFEIN